MAGPMAIGTAELNGGTVLSFQDEDGTIRHEFWVDHNYEECAFNLRGGPYSRDLFEQVWRIYRNARANGEMIGRLLVQQEMQRAMGIAP